MAFEIGIFFNYCINCNKFCFYILLINNEILKNKILSKIFLYDSTSIYFLCVFECLFYLRITEKSDKYRKFEMRVFGT